MPVLLLIGAILVQKVADGVIVADDFEDGVVDAGKWVIHVGDSLTVEEAGGFARVHGVSPATPPPGNGHCGFLSQYTFLDNPPDAVAIAEMRVTTGLTPPKTHGYNEFWGVHLCNWSPDRNSTVALKSYQETWRWVFRVRDETGEIRIINPSLPLYGDEEQSFHTCQVSQLDGVSVGTVWNGAAWDTVGAPTANPELGNKRLELKTVILDRNHPIDVQWDNARVFPHPSVVPVRFKVEDSSYSAAIFRGGALVDSAGTVVNTVNLYLDPGEPIPYEIELRVYSGIELIGAATMPADILEGPYPGDIYHVRVIPPTSADASVAPRSWGRVKGLYR